MPAGTFLRRLTLRGPDGEVFLDRWGIDARLFGVYLHRIVGPDPGLDLHDHPWPFVSVILSGGYADENAEIRSAVDMAYAADLFGGTSDGAQWLPGVRRVWRRGDVRRIRLDEAHRITHVEPGTWTLVLRGRKLRPWGFYMPTGWVDQFHYDYAERRPVTEDRRG